MRSPSKSEGRQSVGGNTGAGNAGERVVDLAGMRGGAVRSTGIGELGSSTKGGGSGFVSGRFLR